MAAGVGSRAREKPEEDKGLTASGLAAGVGTGEACCRGEEKRRKDGSRTRTRARFGPGRPCG